MHGLLQLLQQLVGERAGGLGDGREGGGHSPVISGSVMSSSSTRADEKEERWS